MPKIRDLLSRGCGARTKGISIVLSKQVLFTTAGERVMRPELGGGLRHPPQGPPQGTPAP
jgi:hypothetical protein